MYHKANDTPDMNGGRGTRSFFIGHSEYPQDHLQYASTPTQSCSVSVPEARSTIFTTAESNHLMVLLKKYSDRHPLARILIGYIMIPVLIGSFDRHQTICLKRCYENQTRQTL